MSLLIAYRRILWTIHVCFIHKLPVWETAGHCHQAREPRPSENKVISQLHPEAGLSTNKIGLTETMQRVD